ncbi:hypothetical protein HCJ39_06935 [Listeria rocourtiae]|uniref:hypothetical protein n=1 Tax=Listeria rocourtiae TaxID=647910 RepID=UPI001623F9EB|nr:hypothetical protein [Listeria rocourtiae]MBC1604445.1 hypothetical protein [Listeria rocourtiae]
MTFSNRPYNDRGLKKWRGFFLSEHSQQIADDKKAPEWQTAMDQEVVYHILHGILQHRSMLAIQLYSSNVSPDPYIVGRIAAVEGDLLYVRTDDGQQVVELEAIRYVEEHTFHKWYED